MGQNPAVLILGGTGFLGAILATKLRRDGANVTLGSRRGLGHQLLPSGEQVPVLQFHPDASERQLTERIAGFSVIYDLAGTSGAAVSGEDPLADLETNCTAKLRFLLAAAKLEQPLHYIFASSRLVYGVAQRLPVSEDHPARPLSIYGAHKLSVENYCRVMAVRYPLFTYTSCRISIAYGADEDCATKSHGFLNTAMLKAVEGEPLTVYGSGQQLRDYIHANDVAEALARAAHRPEARNQTINVASGEGISLRQAVEIVAECAGGEVVSRPWPSQHSAVESGDFVADITHMRQTLGAWRTVPFREGIALSVQQFQKRTKKNDLSNPIGQALVAERFSDYK